ncbi:MAG TPA: 6-phosphogluconolactonase [Kofleriaceae bacterium]|jgi:6-phosphogluconolactonase
MSAPVRTFPDLDAAARAAADDFAEIARVAVAARGVCHVALSGGSTPKTQFQVLVARGRDALPWDRIELWWGDERTVPPDHPDSNYGMAKQYLLDPLGLTRVHRMEGERPPDAAAADYERTLVNELGAPPVLDLVWLGMGPDGHTASLFPGSPAVTEKQRYVVANPVDSPVAHGKTTRITLTLPALDAARHVRFLIAGADKAGRLKEVLDGPPGKYPAQMVRASDVEWLVAGDAAAQLGARA